MDQTLAPINPPVGINPNFIMDRPTTLVLKEHILSWSGDDFGVKDIDGNVVVRCSGKVMSMRNRKAIVDPQGNPLFGIHTKLLSFPHRYIGEDANGNELFQVRRHISFKTKMDAIFKNHGSGQDTMISVKGGVFAFNVQLTLGEGGNGPVLANVHRNFWTKGEWFGKQTYFVTVAPGVDLSLVAAICICFDEARNDNKGGYGGSSGGT